MLLPLRRLLVLLFLLGCMGLSAFENADARGGAADAPGGAPAAAPMDAAAQARLGAAYFEQAARWLRNGRAQAAPLVDFHADLSDVQMDVDKRKNEGHMRVWLKSPDKYRVEVRPRRVEGDATIKILDGQRMWIQHPDGRVDRMHGRGDGTAAIEQTQADRERLLDVATFMTLSGFQTPGATFLYEGIHTGEKTLAGTRVHVRRRKEGERDLLFQFEFMRDPADKSGATLRIGAPRVVMLAGDVAKEIEEEYYVLDGWVAGKAHPFPKKIQALSRARPDVGLTRFMLAFPNLIRINAGAPDSLFAPPSSGR
jgi:outer membrane lipoprotein-sorting protein